MDEKLKVELACLLNNINKFYERTKNFTSIKKNNESINEVWSIKKDSKFDIEFIKNYGGDIEDIIINNITSSEDNNKLLAKIIESSNNELLNDKCYSNNGEIPLISIFSNISLNDNNTTDKWYVPLSKLNILDKSIFPVKNYDDKTLTKQYGDLWNKFKYEFDKIDKENFETLLALFKKYASTIPLINDISLYDYTKTNIALTTCKYLSKNNDGYLIINGDISGIQKFIYKITSPADAQSGMSKRLRGRSLYITLLTEAISSKIINNLNLTSANILFCGGGRFTIIAPNIEYVKKTISDFKINLNKFFIETFNSELYLALVYEEISSDDLKNYGDVISRLNNKLSDDKKHKFIENLKDVFEIEDNIEYVDLCPVCGNKLESNTGKICLDCKKHEDLGQKVANAKFMVMIDNPINSLSFSIDILNTSFEFMDTIDEVLKFVDNHSQHKMVIYTLNDSDFLSFNDKISSDDVSFDFKYIGNNVPNISGRTLYFEHLAQISKGSNKLGVLKMDVDNLGKIFSSGFSDKNNQESNFLKISTLSFFMELFFSGRINKIVDKYRVYTKKFDGCGKEIPLKFDDGTVIPVYRSLEDSNLIDENYISTIYINYSGGDDLLVVGPYDHIIEFAKDFREEFKQWTCYNDSVNISAGINISGPKFPIGKAAIISDDYLELSKDCGKNKITVFNEVLNWDTQEPVKGFDLIFDFAKILENYCEDEDISKSFVYSLFYLWKQSFKIQEDISNEKEFKAYNIKKLKNNSYVPYFKYKLRLIKNRDVRENIDKQGIKFMPWIKFPTSWVSLRLR